MKATSSSTGTTIEQVQILFHGASFLDCGSKLVQPAGELGNGRAGGQDLGIQILEKRLNPLPTKLLAVMGEQRGGVEKVPQRSPFDRTLSHEF